MSDLISALVGAAVFTALMYLQGTVYVDKDLLEEYRASYVIKEGEEMCSKELRGLPPLQEGVGLYGPQVK